MREKIIFKSNPCTQSPSPDVCTPYSLNFCCIYCTWSIPGETAYSRRCHRPCSAVSVARTLRKYAHGLTDEEPRMPRRLSSCYCLWLAWCPCGLGLSLWRSPCRQNRLELREIVYLRVWHRCWGNKLLFLYWNQYEIKSFLLFTISCTWSTLCENVYLGRCYTWRRLGSDCCIGSISANGIGDSVGIETHHLAWWKSPDRLGIGRRSCTRNRCCDSSRSCTGTFVRRDRSYGRIFYSGY